MAMLLYCKLISPPCCVAFLAAPKHRKRWAVNLVIGGDFLTYSHTPCWWIKRVHINNLIKSGWRLYYIFVPENLVWIILGVIILICSKLCTHTSKSSSKGNLVLRVSLYVLFSVHSTSWRCSGVLIVCIQEIKYRCIEYHPECCSMSLFFNTAYLLKCTEDVDL